MFKFSTTTYINSANYIDGTPRFSSKDDVDDKEVFRVNHNTVKIKNGSVYGPVYKKIGCVGLPDVATVDLSSCNEPQTTYRLKIYVGLSMADQSAYYANDLVFKGKPFVVEFKGGQTAKEVKETIEKFQILTVEKPILTVDESGNTLTLTGTNAYQRFKSIELEKYVKDDPEIHGLTGEFELVSSSKDENSGIEITQGHEEFGTYYQLTKDNYLPTYEHRRFGANQSDEDPIPGVLYTQYVVKMCVNRGVMGGDAVGELTKSVTTHVFWVNSTVVSDFETALGELKDVNGSNVSIEEVDAHDADGETARNQSDADHDKSE